jgi:hypothetical protein
MRVFGTAAPKAALLQVTVACGVLISLCGWACAADAKRIDPSLFPTIDAALAIATSSFPHALDKMSDLTAVKRVNEEIIYTIKVRPSFQSDADMLRRLYDSKPAEAKTSAMNIMKKTLCIPQPNRFLTTGFTVVYETFDTRGLLSTQKLVAADC